MENRQVIVIGAGIGGLAAGYWLRQRGYEVEILEGTDRPGGRMAFLERKGDRVDVGAQFYHSNYRYAFELADAANLSHSWRHIKGKTQFSLQDGSTHLFGHRDPYMKMLGVRGNLQLYGFLIKYFLLGKRFPMYRITRDIPRYDNVMPLDLYMSPKDQPIRDYIVTRRMSTEVLDFFFLLDRADAKCARQNRVLCADGGVSSESNHGDWAASAAAVSDL